MFSVNVLSNQGGLYSVALLPDPLRQLVKDNTACREKIKKMIDIITKTSELSDGPNGYIGTTVIHKHHRIKLSPSAIGTHAPYISSPITIQLEFGRDIGDVMDEEDVEVEERVVERRRIEHYPMDIS